MSDEEKADNTSKALEKIVQMINDEQLVVFTPDEAKALKELSVVWRQLKAVVVLGGAIGSGLKWLAFIAAIWLSFKAGLLSWFKSAG